MMPVILVIEDEANDVEFMRLAVEKVGFECSLQSASNGQEALDYLAGTGEFADRKKFPLPNFVFLDWKLPYVSGLDLLHWIRNRDEFDAVILIVFTSSKQPRDVELAYRAGANAYVVKPTGFAKLETFVRGFKAFWLDQNELPDTDADSVLASLHTIRSGS